MTCQLMILFNIRKMVPVTKQHDKMNNIVSTVHSAVQMVTSKHHESLLPVIYTKIMQMMLPSTWL